MPLCLVVSFCFSWLLKGHRNFELLQKTMPPNTIQRKEAVSGERTCVAYATSAHHHRRVLLGRVVAAAWEGEKSLPKTVIKIVLCPHLRERWSMPPQNWCYKTYRCILHYHCIFHFAKAFVIWVSYSVFHSTRKTIFSFKKMFYTQCNWKTYCLNF